MTKKDYLIKVLERIGDARPLGKVLLVLGKNGELSDEIIDSLIGFMEEELEKTKDLVKQKKIREGIEFFRRMKDMEEKEKMEDERRLMEMEDIMDDDDILKNI